MKPGLFPIRLEAVILEAFAVGPASISEVIRETHRGAIIIVGRGVVTNKGFDGDSRGKQAGQGGFRGWVNDANSAWSTHGFGGTAPGTWSIDGGRGTTCDDRGGKAGQERGGAGGGRVSEGWNRR